MAEIASVPVIHWPLVIDHALMPSGERLALSTLRGLRLGLLLGIARPSRLSDELEEEGITPLCRLRFKDHRLPSRGLLRRASEIARQKRLDAWLVTAKCRTRLPSHVGNVPVVVVERALDISDETLALLDIA